MKTARFTQIVQKCGKPAVYLPLVDPARDRTLQSAVKAKRVMTVVQLTVGTKADRGVIGFESGKSRQYLIFPKSLRVFGKRTVVGIKYDLLDSREVPKSKRPPALKAPKKPKPKPQAVRQERPEPPEPRKVVAFTPPSEDEESEDVADLKRDIRQAMKALEEGRQVAAFNLLKRIVGK